MMRYTVSQQELETICLMSLRQSIGVVHRVTISLVSGRIEECNWQVLHIEPVLIAGQFEDAMLRLHGLQAAFKLDPMSAETGHGGFMEVACNVSN